MMPVKFRSVGECMAEMQSAGQGSYSLGFGGDTLNTSWYVRALTSPRDVEVEYVTALGADPLSKELLGFFSGHGIGTQFVRNIPDRNIGLYLITLNEGERSFTYWRERSAAKLLAEDEHHLGKALAGADVIYFSGITLAILSPAHREILFHHLQQKNKEGVAIAFDSNVRPRLWGSQQEMKEAVVNAYRHATIALPTFADEELMFGDASPSVSARRIAGYGVAEVVVKDGANASCGMSGGEIFQIRPDQVDAIIDTTGAGDSFNAGYLVARAAEKPILAAVHSGHKVAGRVIGHRGALAPMALFQDLCVSFQP